MITVESLEQNDALVAVLKELRLSHRVCVAQTADETLTVTAYDEGGTSAHRQVFVRADGTTAEAKAI